MRDQRQLKTVDRGSLVIRERESVNVLKELVREEQPEKSSLQRIRSRFRDIKEYKIDLEKQSKASGRKSFKINSILRRQNSASGAVFKQNKGALNQSIAQNTTRGYDSFCPSKNNDSFGTSKSTDKSYRFSLLSQFSTNKILILEEDDCFLQSLKGVKLKQLPQTRTKISHKLIQLKEKGKPSVHVEKLMQVARISQGSFRQLKIRIDQIQRYIKNLQSITALERAAKCKYLKECVKQFQSEKALVLQKAKQFSKLAFVRELMGLFDEEINQLNVLATLFGHSPQDGSIEIVRKKVKSNQFTPFEFSQLKKYCQTNNISI